MPKSFEDIEAELFKRIHQGEAPFLGLFVDHFPANLRKYLLEFIKDRPSPLNTFLAGLERFPASFATFLVIHLMEGFGESGHFDVYSYLEKAIGEHIPYTERKTLWRCFRTSCRKIGLSLSPQTFGPHFMVNEYLRQAGFPLNYLTELTRRMARLGEISGIPDDDDPEAISMWQQSLMEQLRTPFPKVGREAIERDDQGYYVRLFIKLLTQEPHQRSVVEQRIKDALDQIEIGKPENKMSIAFPQVLLRYGEIGILLPGGKNQSWQVRVDDYNSLLKPQEENHFFLIPDPLPKSIEVKRDEIHRTYLLWEGEEDNRLLLFDHPSGKFVKSASLGQEEVALKPGRYTALLRFFPENINLEVEQLKEAPSVFLVPVKLSPGETFKLHRGPAELILHAEDIPNLEWNGELIQDVNNREVYKSQGLSLEVVIPQELLEVQEADYVLNLKPGSLGDDQEITLGELIDGKMLINIEGLGQKWKPGVARVLAELRRRDSRRILARSSILLWNGLQNIQKCVLHCSRLPENLESTENVKIDEVKKQITYKEDHQRYFRMTFRDGPRHHPFTWAVPGIFLNLEEYGDNSGERPLKLGSSLTVTSRTRNVLKIYTTYSGILELGNFREHINFNKMGRKLLPLASLFEYVGPGENDLKLLCDDGGLVISLIHLVSPHEVTDFQIKHQVEILIVEISLQGKVEGFRLTAENLITGTKLCYEFPSSIMEDSTQHESMSWTSFSYNEETNMLTIQINTSEWSFGWWVLEFQGMINGKWGSLVDTQGGIYLGELITNEKGLPAALADIEAYLSNLEIIELEAFLKLIHKLLLPRHALKCESFRRHLEKVWVDFSPKFVNSTSFESLIPWLTERPLMGMDSNWIPHHHLGVDFPNLFSCPRDHYEFDKDHSGNLLLNCLNTFPLFNNPMSALTNGVVHSAVAFGFENAIQIASQGVLPRGFSLGRYRDALLRTELSENRHLDRDQEWQPRNGDYLGPIQYRRAICSLEDTYRQTLVGNEKRRGLLTALIRNRMNVLLNQHVDNLQIEKGKIIIDLGLLETECTSDVESEINQWEEFQGFLSFISLWTYVCRRNVRVDGLLEDFIREIKKGLKSPDQFKSLISYLFYVGEEAFAFYLLLWEFVFTCELDNWGK